jgi:hypothetical protein
VSAVNEESHRTLCIRPNEKFANRASVLYAPGTTSKFSFCSARVKNAPFSLTLCRKEKEREKKVEREFERERKRESEREGNARFYGGRFW